MLKLVSSSLRKLSKITNSGPVQSAAVCVTAGAVGIIAGRKNDCKKTPIAALTSGVVLNLVGLHSIGDGNLGAGAALLGYCRGAGSQSSPGLAQNQPAPTAVRRPVAPPQKKKRRFFGF